jgi:hypothetical protein
MRAPLLALALLAAALPAAAASPANPERCLALFLTYDRTAHNFPNSRWGDNGVTPPSQLSRPIQNLRNAGCLTSSSDLDGMPALAAELSPYVIDNSGPAIRPVPVHLGVVMGIGDEVRVTNFVRGLGYRSRGIGAEGLGRRIYIGPFTTQSALDQALSVARAAGFIAPFPATRTKF